jgi:hypothetical protein
MAVSFLNIKPTSEFLPADARARTSGRNIAPGLARLSTRYPAALPYRA